MPERSGQTLRELTDRIEKLELQRPAFVAELEALADRCHELLDRTEAKRARVAARKSYLDERERGMVDGAPHPPLSDDPQQRREQEKAHIRGLLRAQGKLH